MADGQSPILAEIDIATAAHFRHDIFNRIDHSDTPVVHLDLGDVTFIDSAGYHALVDASDYALRRGRVLVIGNLARLYVAVLRLCDWDDELHLEDTLLGRGEPGGARRRHPIATYCSADRSQDG
jgi:anti-anti-sigma factor